MRTLTQDMLSRNMAIGVALCVFIAASSGQACADHKWQQSSSSTLTVITDDRKSDEVLRLLAEQAHALGLLGLSISANRPIVFILTRDSATVARAWPKNAPDPEGLGGVTYGYPDKIYSIVDRSKSNSSYALRHELVHALLRQRALHIPLWVDEGLADNLASYQTSDDDRLRLGKIDARHRWRQGSCAPNTSLQEVLSRDYQSAGYEAGGGSTVHIADLAVRYLLDHEGLSKILRYLDSSAGSPQEKALNAVFGVDSKQLNEAAIQYCKSGFVDKTISYGSSLPVVDATKAIDAEDAQSAFVEVLCRIQGRATEVVDSLKQQLLLRPEDVKAARGLGIALVYEDKYSEALTYFARTGHVFDSDPTTVYHRLIACSSEASCKGAESGRLVSLLRISRPDLASEDDEAEVESQQTDDEGNLPGNEPSVTEHRNNLAPVHNSTTGPGTTPESVALWLIDEIKKSHEQWERRSPGFDDLPKDFNYTLNGRKISRRSGVAFMRAAIEQDTLLDQFEVTPLDPFPTRMIVTYRQQNTFYNQQKKKGEVFSVFVKDTFDYVNSQWKETQLEAVTAK